MSARENSSVPCLPRATLVQELISAHVSASQFFLAPEHFLNYHLCGNACMIDARLPVRLKQGLFK